MITSEEALHTVTIELHLQVSSFNTNKIQDTYLVAVDVARRFLFYKQLPSHCHKFTNNNRFLEFCESNAQNRLEFVCKSGACTLIGSGKNYDINSEEESCFEGQLNCTVFLKMFCHGLRFTSKSYRRTNKSDDSLIVTRNGTKGKITNICCYEVNENAKVQ